jgi:spermidine synthase
MQTTWLNEDLDQTIFEVGARVSMRVGKKIFEGQSDFQKLEIYETPHYGNMMVLDGCVMLTEANEFSYHEMIAHVPLFAHPNPERVLIIGGGDGGAAREVLRHPQVKECVMVEIDGLVIEKSKEYFPTIASEFDNPRLTLLVDDGVKYIENNKTAFDVILVDSTDPVGPAEGLFSKDFYQKAYNSLKPNGILVAQAESPYYFKRTQRELFDVLHSVFSYATLYTTNIPFYPSGMWSFAYASKEYKENTNPRYADMEKMEENLQYFNRKLYEGCFALPTFVKKNIEKK